MSVALPPGRLADRVEQQVIGADYGADGYTTRAQADDLADRVALGPGTRLLDLGCGRGWPGLYLATITGCHVVLSDIPVQGLRAASGRARADGLAARAQVVAAGGAQLPFRASVFDAVVHADVLC